MLPILLIGVSSATFLSLLLLPLGVDAAVVALGAGSAAGLGWLGGRRAAVRERRRVAALQEVFETEVALARRLHQALEQLGDGHHELASATMTSVLSLDLLAKQPTAPGPEGDAARALLEQARDGLARIAALVLALRAERLTPYVGVKTDLRPAVEASIQAVRARFPRVGVALTIAPGAPEKVTASGGAAALATVVTELLTNACEGVGRRRAAPVSVTIRLVGDGPWGLVEIADGGPGLPVPLRTRDGVPPVLRSTKRGRLGLGLTRCEHVARASGGLLTVEATPDSGARAVLRLPALAEPEPLVESDLPHAGNG